MSTQQNEAVLLSALQRIAAQVPRHTASDKPRLRCWHCRNAWVEGHEPERHHDNCAWVIARNALAASPPVGQERQGRG